LSIALAYFPSANSAFPSALIGSANATLSAAVAFERS